MRIRGRASRITISIPSTLLERLRSMSNEQGRSLSNLCALLLDNAANGTQHQP